MHVVYELILNWAEKKEMVKTETDVYKNTTKNSRKAIIWHKKFGNFEIKIIELARNEVCTILKLYYVCIAWG